MLALIQRVTHAEVIVENKPIGQISTGILAFIGIEKEDSEKDADYLLDRLLHLRIFDDANGKMNLSVKEVSGGLLLVSQFTLAADTESGRRPSFSKAMPPEPSQLLFNYLLDQAHQKHQPTASGQFGAHMKVTLCNDGPVTFLLNSK